MVDEKLRAIGTEFANLAFNWAQSPGRVLTSRDCEMLHETQVRWDAALRETSTVVESHKPQPWVLMPSREEVWLRTFVTLAGFPGVDGAKSREWADRAVEEFDKRFPPK